LAGIENITSVGALALLVEPRKWQD